MDNMKHDVFNNRLPQVKNYIGELVTGIICIALLIYSFVTLGFSDGLDENFITTFIVSFILMIMITSIWYPKGKQKAQTMDADYIKQRLEYGKLVNKVIDTNNQRNLSKFCEWATEDDRILLIKNKLKKITVDYDVYVKYEKKPLTIDNDKDLTDFQKAKLKRIIEKGINIKTIISTSILTGIKNNKLKHDVSSSETKYDFVNLSSKVFTSIISAIVMGFLVFSVGGFSWASVAQLLTWYIFMVWNMFTSHQTGFKSISVHRTNYYKKLRSFLEEFISSDFFGIDKQLEIVDVKKIEEITQCHDKNIEEIKDEILDKNIEEIKDEE